MFQEIRDVLLYALYGALVGIGLWKGNAWISEYVSNFIQWDKMPKKALKIQLLASFAYTTIFILILNSIWYTWVENMGLMEFWFERRLGRTIFLVQFLITVMISAILYTREFFHGWQQSIQNAEELKHKAMSLQYESLKNQLNPHFLFNSLNVLSSLVYKDADQSNMFIKKLSDVYRYVLDQKNKEIVSLKDELAFLDDFVYLHQIRFGTNLKVEMKLGNENGFKLIPMSMQLLVENAIKHNIITSSKPLLIEVIQHEQSIEVRNVLQEKSSVGYSAKIGLENLNAQYEYLSGSACIIEKTEGYFSVKLPFIKFQENDTDSDY